MKEAVPSGALFCTCGCVISSGSFAAVRNYRINGGDLPRLALGIPAGACRCCGIIPATRDKPNSLISEFTPAGLVKAYDGA